MLAVALLLAGARLWAREERTDIIVDKSMRDCGGFESGNDRGVIRK
jgi:hypothetical protein